MPCNFRHQNVGKRRDGMNRQRLELQRVYIAPSHREFGNDASAGTRSISVPREIHGGRWRPERPNGALHRK